MCVSVCACIQVTDKYAPDKSLRPDRNCPLSVSAWPSGSEEEPFSSYLSREVQGNSAAESPHGLAFLLWALL